MKKTVALILAGGRVDELSVLTLYRPKAAVPFGGMYRVIDFALSNLFHSGIDRVGVLSQFRSDTLINHIGSGIAWDMVGSTRGITLLPPMKGTRSSDWYTGTADAVYQNIDFIKAHHPDHVLILSGDHVYKMDYQDMIQYHEQVGADVTLAFVKVTETGAERFGQAVIEDHDEHGGRVLRYVEKPSQLISPWASMTIYLFSMEALLFILEHMMNPPQTEHFGRDIFPVLLQQKKVYGYKFQGTWAYTRTIPEYWQANMSLLMPNPAIDLEKWQVRTNLENQRVRDRAPTLHGSKGEVYNSLIHTGCRINGTVKNSILFSGVTVEEGAIVEDSILIYNTTIEKNAHLQNVITDSEVIAGRGSHVGRIRSEGRNLAYPDIVSTGTTLIGRGTRIPPGIEIGHSCIIYPDKKESDFESSVPDQGMIK